jgi:AbrB family looped-hinge helix DNA binding protein
MADYYRSKVAEAGRVVIPAELRKQYGIEDGGEVVFRKEEDGIRLMSAQQAIRQVQDYFASLAPPDVRLSEELLRDRREEAAREDRG